MIISSFGKNTEVFSIQGIYLLRYNLNFTGTTSSNGYNPPHIQQSIWISVPFLMDKGLIIINLLPGVEIIIGAPTGQQRTIFSTV
jgi:hypothetical protein